MVEFEERNRWQQLSPESHFTQQSVVSLLTATGRVTLTLASGVQRLITTEHGFRSERDVPASDVARALYEHFGILLDDTAVQRLTSAS
jgi:N-hydroxyarylamine O-acetyltransferase